MRNISVLIVLLVICCSAEAMKKELAESIARKVTVLIRRMNIHKNRKATVEDMTRIEKSIEAAYAEVKRIDEHLHFQNRGLIGSPEELQKRSEDLENKIDELKALRIRVIKLDRVMYAFLSGRPKKKKKRNTIGKKGGNEILFKRIESPSPSYVRSYSDFLTVPSISTPTPSSLSSAVVIDTGKRRNQSLNLDTLKQSNVSVASPENESDRSVRSEPKSSIGFSQKLSQHVPRVSLRPKPARPAFVLPPVAESPRVTTNGCCAVPCCSIM